MELHDLKNLIHWQLREQLLNELDKRMRKQIKSPVMLESRLSWKMYDQLYRDISELVSRDINRERNFE